MGWFLSISFVWRCFDGVELGTKFKLFVKSLVSLWTPESIESLSSVSLMIIISSESLSSEDSLRDSLLPKMCLLSGPPRVSQSGVELEIFFEYDFMVSEDAFESFKPYGTVRVIFGPL